MFDSGYLSNICIGNHWNEDFKSPAPSRKLIVFLSSTFTDTIRERTILIDEMSQYLKIQGLPHGVQVCYKLSPFKSYINNSIVHLTIVGGSCRHEMGNSWFKDVYTQTMGRLQKVIGFLMYCHWVLADQLHNFVISEISRCKKESGGVYFLSLQSEK